MPPTVLLVRSMCLVVVVILCSHDDNDFEAYFTLVITFSLIIYHNLMSMQYILLLQARQIWLFCCSFWNTGYLIAKWIKQIDSGEDMWIWLSPSIRGPLWCWEMLNFAYLTIFHFFWCCMPSMVQLVNTSCSLMNFDHFDFQESFSSNKK